MRVVLGGGGRGGGEGGRGGLGVAGGISPSGTSVVRRGSEGHRRRPPGSWRRR